MKIFSIITGLFFCSVLNLYAQSLPTLTSNLFSGSGNCAICHQPGPPNTSALLTQSGADVSSVTLWRSTIMANAAKDPLWQAKVSAEVLANPHIQTIIEDKCTTCHAPTGRTEAHFLGQTNYSLLETQTDPLALDGVTCTVCHQIKTTGLGSNASFSGGYVIENDRIIYGPYQNPLTTPMQMTVNYTPQYGAHITESEICGTCHTLFTPTINNSGQIEGEIAEQTPYLEWVNSIYPNQGVTCQECHMPEVGESIVISNRPHSLAPRGPYYNHYFVGGNVFTLKILRDNINPLGITASPDQIDSTIHRTIRLLQTETAELNSDDQWIDDTLVIKVAVKNLTGHKFPSGFPSRRAWIFLQVTNDLDQIVFSSGEWNHSTGEIDDLDSLYERHFDIISDSSQVQIYQSIMQDIDSNITYTLLRGASYIKDNRVPPIGFTTQGPYYDSISVAGYANIDPNFNRSQNLEGTGTDTVTYKIGNLNQAGHARIDIKLLYQSNEPRFIQDLFQYSSPEIQEFQSYYQSADKSPVILDSLQLLAVIPTEIKNQTINTAEKFTLSNNYPNPFNPVTQFEFNLPYSDYVKFVIINSNGEIVQTLLAENLSAGQHYLTWNASNYASGIYYYQLVITNQKITKKCLLLK
jgi:hypothetical protein